MMGEEVVRTFYSLNNFKVYDTVLFIIVIIIYMWFTVSLRVQGLGRMG